MENQENNKAKEDIPKDDDAKNGNVNDKEKACVDLTEPFNGNDYTKMENDTPQDETKDFVIEEVSQSGESGRDSKRIYRFAITTVILMMLTVTSIVVIPILMRDNDNERKIEIFSCRYNDGTKIDVEIDDMKKTILATETKKKIIYTQTKTFLHVYPAQILAVLDRYCFIFAFDETFEEGILRWNFHKDIAPRTHMHAKHLTPHQSIAKMVLKNVLGEDVYELCKDVDSFWAKEVHGESIAQLEDEEPPFFL